VLLKHSVLSPPLRRRFRETLVDEMIKPMVFKLVSGVDAGTTAIAAKIQALAARTSAMEL